jgi:hypothetical protein
MTGDRIASWLDALERTHLADLTMTEVARALRALSSCYVERRSKLPEGAALSSRGKRAAFALFYGPVHLFVIQEIVRALRAIDGTRDIVDVGCGTGAAGVAWALESRARAIRGFDRHPWAVGESNATYRHFQLEGRASQRDVSRTRLDVDPGARVIAAYTANELNPDGRAFLLHELLRAHARGAAVLVVEPIAQRPTPWWGEWVSSLGAAGSRLDEWRFRFTLPKTQHALARAAGLNPRELTAKTLWLPSRPRT